MIDFEIKATQLLLFVDTVDTKRHLQAKQCISAKDGILFTTALQQYIVETPQKVKIGKYQDEAESETLITVVKVFHLIFFQ